MQQKVIQLDFHSRIELVYRWAAKVQKSCTTLCNVCKEIEIKKWVYQSVAALNNSVKYFL